MCAVRGPGADAVWAVSPSPGAASVLGLVLGDLMLLGWGQMNGIAPSGRQAFCCVLSLAWSADAGLDQEPPCTRGGRRLKTTTILQPLT